jgi:hypothetical protein|tara:strand:+ start:3099 stop:3860 length:762 start_codon:yes stop_codon:yes gene_type:complete
MDNEFRLTSREYAAILGIQPEALRSRRRRGLENGNFKEIDKKFWWKTPLKDRPFIVNSRSDSRQNPGPGSSFRASRYRRRGALIKGLKTNYHNARNGWQLEEHNLVKHLAKIRYDKGDKIVDEITPEVIKIAKKNLDEKNLKAAEETLKKNVDPGPGIPVGIDRVNPKYGSMLNAKGLQKVDDDYHKRKSYLYNYRSEHGTRSNSLFFGNFGQSEREERESVEIDPNNFTPDNDPPEFKNKIEEEIWRLKNRK